MDQTIIDFVEGKRIAVVGVSRTGKKFGNVIFKELKDRGYEVHPVHPEAESIDGQPCVPNVAALAGKVDGVLICVSPGQSEQALRDAAAAGVKNIWLQQGSQSPGALSAANELGVKPVTGKCILMYVQPVGSIHGIHRAIARIFGQL